MTKQQLVRKMESEYGSFMNVNETAEFFKMHRNTARKMLYGLQFRKANGKSYLIDDIAERYMEGVQI